MSEHKPALDHQPFRKRGLTPILAHNFQAIKDILETGPQGAVQVIQSMDEDIDILFPFSEIYEAGREFFLLAVKGTLPLTFDLTKLAAQARSDAASP